MYFHYLLPYDVLDLCHASPKSFRMLFLQFSISLHPLQKHAHVNRSIVLDDTNVLQIWTIRKACFCRGNQKSWSVQGDNFHHCPSQVYKNEQLSRLGGFHHSRCTLGSCKSLRKWSYFYFLYECYSHPQACISHVSLSASTSLPNFKALDFLTFRLC